MITDIISTLTLSLGLLLASIMDLKTREIRDEIWVIMGAIGVSLRIFSFIKGELIIPEIISIIVMAAITTPIYIFHAFGEADIEALIAISILQPLPPTFISKYDLPLFPLSVFLNAAITAMMVPIMLFAKNIFDLSRGRKIFENFREPAYKKTLALFIGCTIDYSDKPPRFLAPMEVRLREQDTLIKKFNYVVAIDKYFNWGERDKGIIWVTPGLPFIFFIFLGYLEALLVGDLTFKIRDVILKLI